MIGTASTKTLLSQLAVCDLRASLAPAALGRLEDLT